MINILIEIIQSPLARYAFVATLLGALASGLLSPYVAARRLNLIAGTLSHTLLGAIGLALWLQSAWAITWAEPLYISLIFALIAALVLSITHIYYQDRQDSLMAILWSSGMSLGVLFSSIAPSGSGALSDYLFGTILWTSSTQLMWLGLMNMILVVVVWSLYKLLLLACFDPEHLTIQRVRFHLIYTFLILLIALVVVVLMQTMGVLVAMTLLSTPALIASSLTRNFQQLHQLSVGISVILAMMGFIVAAIYDLPAGAVIALIAVATYTALILIQSITQKRNG